MDLDHILKLTLSRTVVSNLYSSRRTRTTSACPFSAAQWSMVKPWWSVLCSRDVILGTRYWMVFMWPHNAARCSAFLPYCIKGMYSTWLHIWYGQWMCTHHVQYMTDDRDSRLPYPKGHTVSGYRHSVQSGVLPSYWGAAIVTWLNSMDTVQPCVLILFRLWRLAAMDRWLWHTLITTHALGLPCTIKHRCG